VSERIDPFRVKGTLRCSSSCSLKSDSVCRELEYAECLLEKFDFEIDRACFVLRIGVTVCECFVYCDALAWKLGDCEIIAPCCRE
jgi:hypothetical protein